MSMIDLNPYRRIEDDLQQLAQYTEEPTRKGVTRRLYSPQWAAAQRHLVQLMRGEGLNPWVDAVGNVHGRIEGRSRHTILTGSHFDTVRGGGAYDGVYGVVAGIFALSQIKKRCRVPEKSLEVVAFCEEEGSRFPMTCLGSRAILGAWQPEEVARLVDDQGTSLFEAMQMNGLDWRSMGEANRSDYEAYIELHVEQGPELEDAQCAIGVVSEIFGQERWLVSVRGDSAHAGTTPLARRQDALVAASAMVLAINTLGYRYEPIGIATVGILEVIHGSINCVPGHVQFSVDFRAAQDSVRQRLADEIRHAIEDEAKRYGVRVNISPKTVAQAVPMHESLRNTIGERARAIGLSQMPIASRAGHDAQIIAQALPTAMIFVPSAQGLSHHPDEYTHRQHLMNGSVVLESTLEKLANG
ncbi:hypothetical protein BXT84_09440 [Sulfobacillus thermotolerans]|uniref:Peptidase M20 dimerisation domain-containing protein n=1 Tax=Sulfobacillus thermotolerans TaxID=338644 RepID=A0ABM6RS42_9FIRM|nr:hypothetical protein BXT84_09440 [Sulfobacillus thermotolerans]